MKREKVCGNNLTSCGIVHSCLEKKIKFVCFQFGLYSARLVYRKLGYTVWLVFFCFAQMATESHVLVLSLQKLYAVCDLALGLMNVKTNITLKDSNVEPPLPAKLFTPADKVTCVPILERVTSLTYSSPFSFSFGLYSTI